INYSNRCGPDNTWGIAVSASYEERDYSNDQITAGWQRRTVSGQERFLPNIHEWKPADGEITRMGGNLNLEFRPDGDTQAYLRTNWSSTERFVHSMEIISRVNNQQVTF